MRRTARAAVRTVNATGSALAVGLAAHTAWNLRRLRRPTSDPPHVGERVSILLPVRDEAAQVEASVRGILAQRRVDDLELLVLDDSSQDATVEIVRAVAGTDPRLRLLHGGPVPEGWLGKPRACHLLAQHATGSVLVFVDADVILKPLAVASAVAVLRGAGVDAVSPYPRQLADGIGPRLVQPLLQWSLLALLPMGLAERAPRRSTAAANGQFLVIDRDRYAAAGGHGSVRAEVLDDVMLSRAIVSAGGRAIIIDGTALATCRMYQGWSDLREGYTKSLWSAFGSPFAAAGALGMLAVAFIVPPATALLGRRLGRADRACAGIGLTAGILSRVMVARRTGQRVWPDCAAHPASIGALMLLTAGSFRARRRGTLTWKGRPIHA